MKTADGQMTIFDTGVSRRPCEYPFQRYIGQSVTFWRSGITGRIIEIEPYYTFVQTAHGEMVGAPHEINPTGRDND